MTKILWKYTFTYIIVMAESNDWTQVRKCEASPESKWNSYQEKLQKEAQDRERENRYKLEEDLILSLLTSVTFFLHTPVALLFLLAVIAQIRSPTGPNCTAANVPTSWCLP